MNSQSFRAFLILEKSKFNRLLNVFKKRDWPRLLVFLASFLVTLLLGLGTYFFAKSTFALLKFYPEFLEATTLFILLSLFFLILVLSLGASIVSAMGILFAQEDDNLLISLPVKNSVIFLSRFVNLLFFSSWPVIAFGIPLLLAFQKEFGLGFSDFLLSFFALTSILVISTFLASHLSLVITASAGQSGKRWLKILGLLGLPLLSWWVAYILIPPNFFDAFQKIELKQLNEFLKSLPIHSSLLPSTWAANTVFYLRKNPFFAYINFGKLIGFSLFLGFFLRLFAQRLYYSGLAKEQIGKFIAGPQDKTTPAFKKRRFPYFFKGLKGAFLEKDILMFGRDQTEMLQAGFIVFIALLYFLLLGKIPLEKITEAAPAFSKTDLIKINTGVISFILTVLSLRFVFPAISIEGQSAWLIWGAPFSKAKLFLLKLLTGLGLVSSVGIIASVLSALILKLNLSFFTAQLSIFLASSLALTSIHLGIGAILPNFEEKNPEKLSTSFGGILAIFLSLTYIFVVNLVLFTLNGELNLSSFTHIAVWIISLGTSAAVSILALSKIESYQF